MPDLDDRQEPARARLSSRLDPPRARSPFVDELLEAAAADRDERDLGRDEDAVEQDRSTMMTSSTTGRSRAVHRGSAARVRREFGRRLRARLADAGRDADRELARRHVARDHGAGAGPRALADVDRRDEHRVDADERAVADRRAVLAWCRRSWR